VLKLAGNNIRINRPAHSIRVGIMLCPEDRKSEGIIPIRSVAENINLSVRRKWSRFGFFIDGKREAENAAHFIERLRIKTPSPNQLIKNLSGGNQQKTILSRWLSEDIQVLLMDEPTRGIDVGAKSEIYSIMYELAQKGIAIIMVSSDLPEVMGVSDRIFVMREGCLVGEMPRERATQESLLNLALPVSEDKNRGEKR